MLEHWPYRPSSSTPLPRSLEVSLSVALVAYQGHATVSLSMGRRAANRSVRHNPISLDVVTSTPQTYGEALDVLYEYVVQEKARLSSEEVR